jgi:vancomycin permeability regulator SanA
MLEERIKVGVGVLNRTGANYILMSGEKSGEYYDEPAAMKKYAEEMGVDPSRILVDNKGFSTFESMTRVKDEYGFDNVIVITQKYHLYRALYIAEDAGIEALGVSADLRPYRNQFVREIREILARVKDLLLCI